MQTLAVKYRPKEWQEVVSQESIVKILTRQIELNQIKNTYLFCGSSGCGKTTVARLFARAINNNIGEPIEIDGASNNGVDNVKAIIKSAQERAIDGKYKTYIIDECVTGDTEVLTNEGWKRFDSLNKTEKIAQYNNGKIEFVTPTEYIEKDYVGDMYRVNIAQNISFMMSPNHVQPLMNKQGDIVERYIKDIDFDATTKFVRGGEGVGQKQTLSPMDKLAIALHSLGDVMVEYKDYNQWEVRIMGSRMNTYFRSIIDDCNEINFKPFADGAMCTYYINTPKDISPLLSTHFSLEDVSKSYAEQFLKEITYWASALPFEDDYIDYQNEHKENLDFCQCVAILCGYSSRVEDTELYINKGSTNLSNLCVTKSVEQYDGKIYCVKVPSHMILIRRDGYEIVTGNCHALTNQAWQAFLKCIEEPPTYTVFIFCTTDPQKIPSTILNRVQRFNFTRIPSNKIRERLNFICRNEGFNNYEQSTDYISKICNGEMRNGIAMLDKCSGYSTDLSINNVLVSLGNYSYNMFFSLISNMMGDNEAEVAKIVDDIYNSGNDMKIFIDQFLDFIIDIKKYTLFNSCDLLKIPSSMESNIKAITSFEKAPGYYGYVANKLLDLKIMVKNDTNIKDTILVMLWKISRCEK